jgi:hypothetical protein
MDMRRIPIATIHERTSYSRHHALGGGLHRQLTQWTIGVFASFAVAATAGLAGFAFLTLSQFGVGSAGSTLSTIGAVLMIASFLLFFLGAHCLDKADAADKAIRRELGREHDVDEFDR